MKGGRDHAAFYLNLSRTGGGVVPYRVEGRAAFLVNRPEYAEHVLSTNQLNYKNPHHPYAELAGHYTPAGSALLRLGRARRAGGAAAALPEATRALAAESEAAAAKLLKLSEAGPVCFDLEAKEMMFRAVTRILFGVDAGHLSREFVGAVTFLEECWADDLHAARGGRPDPPPTQRYEDAFRIESETARWIAREAGMATGGGEVGAPLLDAVVRTLLNGYNATATALCWAVHLVSRDAPVQRRLHAEVDGVLAGGRPAAQDLGRMRHLRMVVAETLRLYPPAWVLGRESLSEDWLGETRIPAGSVVSVSPYTMHRHPRLWERASEFVPERFDPERAPAPAPFAYFPFGGGARRCPAAPFVVGHLQTVLAVLLSLCRVEAAPDARVRPRGLITLRPDPCVLVRFVPRERRG